jgi:glycine C-acetyltransferase
MRLSFDTGTNQSPITPVFAGEGKLAISLNDQLFEEEVFTQGIGYATVADTKSGARTLVTATNTRHDLEDALRAFEKVGLELGLIHSPAGHREER